MQPNTIDFLKQKNPGTHKKSYKILSNLHDTFFAKLFVFTPAQFFELLFLAYIFSLFLHDYFQSAPMKILERLIN